MKTLKVILIGALSVLAFVLGFKACRGNVPTHQPHESCGVIVQKFTHMRGQYKGGSTEIPHFVLDIDGQKVDMQVSWQYYVEHEVGERICNTFCGYYRCDDNNHFYQPEKTTIAP